MSLVVLRKDANSKRRSPIAVALRKYVDLFSLTLSKSTIAVFAYVAAAMLQPWRALKVRSMAASSVGVFDYATEIFSTAIASSIDCKANKASDVSRLKCDADRAASALIALVDRRRLTQH